MQSWIDSAAAGSPKQAWIGINRIHRLKPVADELFDELRPQGPLHGAARGCHVVHGVDADAALEHFKRKLVKVFGPKRKVDTGSRLTEQPHSAFECLVQPRVAEAGVPRPQLGFSQGLTSGRLRPRQDGWRWNCTLLQRRPPSNPCDVSVFLKTLGVARHLHC